MMGSESSEKEWNGERERKKERERVIEEYTTCTRPLTAFVRPLGRSQHVEDIIISSRPPRKKWVGRTLKGIPLSRFKRASPFLPCLLALAKEIDLGKEFKECVSLTAPRAGLKAIHLLNQVDIKRTDREVASSDSGNAVTAAIDAIFAGCCCCCFISSIPSN